MGNRANLWAIVLAAGRGQRLEPFLRRCGHQRPIKQFCAILGQRTMLEHTWKRVEMIVPRVRVLTVVDAAHAAIFGDQLANRAKQTVILQPANRETAPGTLLPLAHVLRADPEAIVGIFPSDHFVHEEERFMGYVQTATWAVRHRFQDTVVLGVQAAEPDSEYGWIEVRRADRLSGSCLLPVERFWEKPAPPLAKWLYDGGHLWSTMVTVARAAALWDLIGAAQPQLRQPFERIQHALGTDEATMTIRRAYEEMPCVSLSQGVFERSPSRLAALAMRDVYWSDWGCEERVNETLRQFAPNMPTNFFPTEAAVRPGWTVR